MIWYYKQTLFYGEMCDGKKHGSGLEINLITETSSKGKFQAGMKTGYFHIESPQHKYYGMLLRNEYQGEGHLLTNSS